MPTDHVNNCAKELARRGLTISFAESATAGRVSFEFSRTPYSGDILKGGLICYDACIKEDVLHIPHTLINKYSPESAEVTAEMARGIQKLLKTDVSVGITGLPAPGGSESHEKPVGTMFIAVLINGQMNVLRKEFKGSPERVISNTVRAVARFVTQEL